MDGVRPDAGALNSGSFSFALQFGLCAHLFSSLLRILAASPAVIVRLDRVTEANKGKRGRHRRIVNVVRWRIVKPLEEFEWRLVFNSLNLTPSIDFGPIQIYSSYIILILNRFTV